MSREYNMVCMDCWYTWVGEPEGVCPDCGATDTEVA